MTEAVAVAIGMTPHGADDKAAHTQCAETIGTVNGHLATTLTKHPIPLRHHLPRGDTAIHKLNVMATGNMESRAGPHKIPQRVQQYRQFS